MCKESRLAWLLLLPSSIWLSAFCVFLLTASYIIDLDDLFGMYEDEVIFLLALSMNITLSCELCTNEVSLN
jgi:hypothetical protein